MIIAGAILASVIILEIIVKFIVKKKTAEKPLKILGGCVEISVCENRGLVLSKLKDKPGAVKILHSVSVVVCILLLIKPVMSKDTSAVFKVGAGLVLGGGISNLLDRLTKGFVTDYIRFCKSKIKKLRRIKFNIADFCIAIGAILLIIGAFKKSA